MNTAIQLDKTLDISAEGLLGLLQKQLIHPLYKTGGVI